MDVDWQRIFHKDPFTYSLPPRSLSEEEQSPKRLRGRGSRGSEQEDHEEDIHLRESLMGGRPWSMTSTRAPGIGLPKPFLAQSSSFHDFYDYFHHVFDDDETAGEEGGRREQVTSQSTAQGSHRHLSISTTPSSLSLSQDHHERGTGKGHQLQSSQQESQRIINETSPTRHVYNSERIDSTQPSSPLCSVGTHWTVQAVEMIMKNPTDPIGKVPCLSLSS